MHDSAIQEVLFSRLGNDIQVDFAKTSQTAMKTHQNYFRVCSVSTNGLWDIVAVIEWRN